MLDVQGKATALLAEVSTDPKLGRFVEPELRIPKIVRGAGDIRLVVLGQDPTVKNPASRPRITTVLNLDKRGSLRNYLIRVCEALGLELDQNVYATNYLKNFFVKRPRQIEEIDVFKVFGPKWLPLLQEELAQFPQAPVIALGEPLLRALVLGDASPRVRDYWGYTPLWQSGQTATFRYLSAQDNRLGRIVFPFPHQPSIAKRFYAERLGDYTAFVKQEALSA